MSEAEASQLEVVRIELDALVNLRLAGWWSMTREVEYERLTTVESRLLRAGA